MPRSLDATLKTDLSAERTTLVHLLEIAEPNAAAGSGTLTKVVDGLSHDLKIDSLSDLSGFSIIDGSWSLVSNRLRATDNTTTNSLIRYNGYTGATLGKIVQVLMQRSGSPSPGMPGMAVLVEPTVTSGLDQFLYTINGATNLGGAGFWGMIAPSEAVTPNGLNPGTQQDFHGLGHFDPIYNRFSLGIDSGFKCTFGINTIDRNVDFGAFNIGVADGRIGLVARWEDTNGTPNSYPDYVEFDRISVYNGPDVVVIGAPPGSKPTMDNPEITSGGTGVTGGSFADATYVATIDSKDQAFPYNTIRLNLGATQLAIANTVEVWGGDVWQYTPGSPSPVLNFTTASEELPWDSKTWLPMSGQLGFSGVQESLDRAAQNVDLEMPAVLQSEVLEPLLTNNYKGKRARLWVAHINDTTGALVGTPYMIWDGYFQNGFDVQETY